jgi:hypothetical protein
MKETKKRHWSWTIWLILIIIWYSILLLSFTVGGERFTSAIPGPPTKVKLILPQVVAVGSIILALALFMWQKWAFWGLLILYIWDFFINLILRLSPRATVVETIYRLVGLAILYGLLQIGGKDSGWRQLE